MTTKTATATATTLSSFCASFEWTKSLAVTWFDSTGIVKLSDDRRVKIDLATNGVAGEYAGFAVTIVSKTGGVIDSKFFAFAAYLDATKRSDARPEYKGSFRVVSHCGIKWYIAIPASTKSLTSAIESYIGMWR